MNNYALGASKLQITGSFLHLQKEIVNIKNDGS
jgi:hypothetical protein